MSDIVFLDTETLGLDPAAPIWEFAAIRQSDPDMQAETLHLFINNPDDAKWLESLPEPFAQDYRTRFGRNYGLSVSADIAAHQIREFLDGRPHIVGAVPSFDTERIARQLMEPHGFDRPWHYHLIDVENLVVGYLRGLYMAGGQDMPIDPPWKSDELSRAVGVDPEQFDRHTAMGDVLWVRAQYDAVMGGPHE